MAEGPGSIWSTVANLNTARSGISGCGVSNSALAIGGYDSGGIPLTSVELYNGTTWATVNSMNYARLTHGMCGASDNALAFGGLGPTFGDTRNTTELYS